MSEHPSLGRTVHFVDYRGRHLDARITEEGEGEAGQTLHVSEIDPGSAPVTVRRGVKQNPDMGRDTWHWPERR